jgi:hypothetical protein
MLNTEAFFDFSDDAAHENAQKTPTTFLVTVY